MPLLRTIRRDFDINRVIAGITAKLERRHPHVFGEAQVDGAAQVVRNWEAIKRTEGAEAEISAERKPRSLLAGVPRHLPSLQRAQKVQGKAALVGFDWPDARSASTKLAEEWQELQSAWSDGDEDAVRQELGDLLFAVVNVARLLKVDAEEALRAAVDKFIRRFQGIEARALDRGLNMSELVPGRVGRHLGRGQIAGIEPVMYKYDIICYNFDSEEKYFSDSHNLAGIARLLANR